MQIKNRIVLHRTNASSKIIHDYLTRKDAITAFYEICDKKGFTYGKPVYATKNGIKSQVGMESVGNEYRIVLYL